MSETVTICTPCMALVSRRRRRAPGTPTPREPRRHASPRAVTSTSDDNDWRSRRPERLRPPPDAGDLAVTSAERSGRVGRDDPFVERRHWWDLVENQGVDPAALADANPPVNSPWNLGFQLSERYIEWTDDQRVDLIVAFAAKDLGIGPEEARSRLARLVGLFPPLRSKIPVLSAPLVATALRDLGEAAARAIVMRAALPTADVGELVSNRPPVLVWDRAELDGWLARAAPLRAAFPRLDVDAAVTDLPSLLASEPWISRLTAGGILSPGALPRALPNPCRPCLPPGSS